MKLYLITETTLYHFLSNYVYYRLMSTTPFLEHDNASFSKILLSKEVAEIIKQIVRESNSQVHLKCNDGENIKGGCRN